MVVELEYQPRTPFHAAIHAGMDTHRFGAIVTHRRFGKSVLAINHLQIAALQCRRERPRFGFVAPTYTQAKSIAWDYLAHYARPIPGCKLTISELLVTYPHGGQVRLFGADNPDSLRGLYFDGLVLDEYGLQPPSIFSEVLRPALSDRQGWALFAGTPAGKNQFYDVVQQAQRDQTWFFACHRASETGIIPPEELAAARKDMTEDEYQQEYECSFEAAIKGAIYRRELETARAEGRIGVVPYMAGLRVHTYWDLGVGDATAIWFAQVSPAGEVRLIDYYEASGEGLPHYLKVLDAKPYLYGTHYGPHDLEVRELGSGQSRRETARALGLTFNVVPNIPLEDGLHAARLLMGRCWFDAQKCAAGLEALTHYRWDYNARLEEFKTSPLHDWASHGADAFRYLALAQRTPKPKPRGGHWTGAPPGPLGWLG